MKTKIIVGVFLVSSTLIGFSQVRKAIDPKCATFPREGRVDVNLLVDAPMCATRTVEIQGVVNAIHPEKRALMLIDLSEQDNCEDGCPTKRLPVTWTGTMPTKGAKVIAAGMVKEEEKKFVFKAERLTQVPKSESQ